MKPILAATAIALFATGIPTAFAADYEPAASYQSAPLRPSIQAHSSGWYIRGDIGHNFKSKTDGGFRVYEGTYRNAHYEHMELRSNTYFGAGAGYRLNAHLRGDVTLAYWNRSGFGSATLDDNWSFDDSSSASALEMMANAYVDLKTFGRVTPYVGGGLGTTYLRYDRLTNRATCINPSNCSGLDYVAWHEGEESWRFTWALMAGVSVDLIHRAKLDLGYRYAHVAGGDAFGFDAGDIAAGATGVQGWDNGFGTHQIRAGLRYEFGGAQIAAYKPEPFVMPAPQPVYEAPVYK